MTLDDDEEGVVVIAEDAIPAPVAVPVPVPVPVANWWCNNCRLFQQDLTLGTCWIPLQDIGPECGTYVRVCKKKMNTIFTVYT